MTELNYESEIAREWLRGEPYEYFDYITTIKFTNENFGFDFHPRIYDYEDIERFLVKFVEKKGCRLSLYDETVIVIESSGTKVVFKIGWQDRPGVIMYNLNYEDCVKAFGDLLADLKKYNMEVVEETPEPQEGSEEES